MNKLTQGFVKPDVGKPKRSHPISEYNDTKDYKIRKPKKQGVQGLASRAPVEQEDPDTTQDEILFVRQSPKSVENS